jgi:hypothetical protein
MNKCISTTLIFPLLLFYSLSYCQTIPDSVAYKYIGTTTTVCGYVASAKFAKSSRSQPTFLNMGRSYPNQTVTIVIWGENRGKFNAPPESLYVNKTICVRGKIKKYKNKPEIIIKGPEAVSGGE